jgi:hypothetical protein
MPPLRVGSRFAGITHRRHAAEQAIARCTSSGAAWRSILDWNAILQHNPFTQRVQPFRGFGSFLVPGENVVRPPDR